MWNNLKVLSNPQQALNNLIQNNPQLGNVLQMSKGDPRQAFYLLAEQKGIDPNYILNMLK